MPRLSGRVMVVVVAVLVLVVAAVVFVDFDFGDEGDVPTSGRRREAKVTEADNGREVTVPSGTPFVVDLKGSEDAPWGLPQPGGEGLALISSSVDLDGSAGATFMPLEVTSGVLITAERVPACQLTLPACADPTERFEVTIRVVPA